MSYRPLAKTAVSAPGKVLLTGGYLVLDRQYTGTVFALNARIHVVVRQLRRNLRRGGGAFGGFGLGRMEFEGDGETDAGNVGVEEGGDEVIVVRSPQFIDAVWEPRNPYVETSINYALTYVSYIAASNLFGSLSITILADNDYYSQPSISQTPVHNGGTRFVDFGVKLHEAHKTGLGSSAALVTALVSAIVIHRSFQPEELPAVRDKLHNLAQAAHCAAQGKIGSGFDVGAAVYGSCLYRRFSPAVLDSLGDVGSPQFEDRLFAVVEDLNEDVPWDTECIDFGIRLPRGMQIVLCDVDCGSQTPGMVKKVLQWREENREEADALWDELQTNNEKLRLLLKELVQASYSSNNRNINYAENGNFDAVGVLISRTRELLRTMTAKSGVPIEPKVQTELLDKLSELDGVIGGVVPGAGGYDADALLIRDDAAVVDSLRDFLSTWKSTVEDDFGGRIERVRLLGVTHGSEGLRNEVPVKYSEWM
ncbi:phosphomevalonate kinase [Paracoccidioides lutzii Pb01]|uniref:Phosphomevalonate kinase n=1 Tax=Paracoccidioides lutzii (strain ATCC MYA-826 / Pb01) TaxID=502779 RepID=A0A0A2V6L9_PARBA|nr:phosphomevalonate kinase [Paracoccidioides lutzii Pb01]KGQ01745.1 phosphomevalonate kinase [Paracoccidioides lutzii Pb01]